MHPIGLDGVEMRQFHLRDGVGGFVFKLKKEYF